MTEIIATMNAVSRIPHPYVGQLEMEREGIVNNRLAHESTRPVGLSVAEMPEGAILARVRLDPNWGRDLGLPELRRRDLEKIIPAQHAANSAWEAEEAKRSRAVNALELARMELLQAEKNAGMTRKDFWCLTGEQLVESCTTMKDDTTRTLAWKQRYMTAAQNELLQRRADGIPESVSPRRFLNRTEPE